MVKIRMKKIFSFLLSLVLIFSLAACGTGAQENGGEKESAGAQENGSGVNPDEQDERAEDAGGQDTDQSDANAAGTKIKMITEHTEVIITLNDSKAAADLAAMLPLELTLIERSGFAKGMTLPQQLSSEEETTREYEIGDFGYWDAGPDLAIFYDDIYEQTIVEVIPLGHAQTGAESMAGETGIVRLELLEEEEKTENAVGKSNILIVYFSVMETDGVDTVASASRVVADGELLGNNEYIARLIRQETGGDLFSIKTVQEYPTTHEPLLDFAYEEKRNDARPALATQIENLEDYDVIFLGFPNWNADLPMPLYTFLEEYDFGGKTIVPFTTHGGSGFSRTIRTISELQPDATVLSDGLSISRNRVPQAQKEVVDWVKGLGLTAE